MRLQRTLSLSVAALGWLVISVPLLAQDKKGAADKAEETKKAGEAKKTEPGKGGAPSAVPGMDEWAKAMAVGPEHAKLKALVGSWEHVTKFKMYPEAPWQESKGSTEFKEMMGGRFIRQDVKSAAMMEGMPPFEGFGLSGYDNILKKYVTIWTDNMSTGIMMSYGTPDATGKVVTYMGEFPDPATGSMKKYKSVSRFKDEKTHVFEMYDTGPDGKEFMTLEVTYTKK